MNTAQTKHNDQPCEFPSGVLYNMAAERMVRLVENNSVDLVITSPPYGNARNHDYGGINPSEYIHFFAPIALGIKRALKPTGSFILNIKENAVGGERNTYVLDLILYLKREVGFRWVDEYIWHKSAPFPGKWPNRFRDAWERLLHFTIEPDFKMNQDAVRIPVGEWSKRLKNLTALDKEDVTSANNSGFTRNRSNWVGRDTVYPTNVLFTSSVNSNVGHSAAYPQAIPEFFIRLFTDTGDLVFDPFMGSGTTAIVAERLGRAWVGSEISEKYVEIAKKNIENSLVQRALII